MVACAKRVEIRVNNFVFWIIRVDQVVEFKHTKKPGSPSTVWRTIWAGPTTKALLRKAVPTCLSVVTLPRKKILCDGCAANEMPECLVILVALALVSTFTCCVFVVASAHTGSRLCEGGLLWVKHDDFILSYAIVVVFASTGWTRFREWDNLGVEVSQDTEIVRPIAVPEMCKPFIIGGDGAEYNPSNGWGITALANSYNSQTSKDKSSK
mmetsp:Transcript_3181/g.6010  ORF Transcript_3181/g.6010 Transcript_3181/m.6010 type:complete len:210 (+) Transcript_3181:1152-1781(+)